MRLQLVLCGLFAVRIPARPSAPPVAARHHGKDKRLFPVQLDPVTMMAGMRFPACTLHHITIQVFLAAPGGSAVPQNDGVRTPGNLLLHAIFFSFHS